VVYPYEIDVAVSSVTNDKEQKLDRTKQTTRLRTIPELMAKGFTTGNSQSPSKSSQWSFGVCSISSSLSEREGNGCSSGPGSSTPKVKRG